MVKKFNLKQNDLQPYYFFKFVDSNKIGIDLTGASIVCTMKSTAGAGIKIDRQSAGIVILDQTTNKGEGYYQWQAGETDTVDNYKIEFEVTPAIGGKFTMPNNDDESPAIVKINASLDTI